MLAGALGEVLADTHGDHPAASALEDLAATGSAE